MRRSLLIVLLVVIVSAVCASRPLAAQETGAKPPEMIPREVVLALIPAAAANGGDILVGAMPGDISKDFPVPAGGRVIGSLVTLSYAQVVIALPGSPDSALAYAKRTLIAHGWLPREPAIMRQGGLQYGPAMMPTTTFCRLGQGPPDGISTTTSFYGPTTTLLRLTRTQNPMCEESQGTAMGSSVALTSRYQGPFSNLPPLFAPGDQRTVFTGCRATGSSGQRATQNQQLRLALSPTEILAHYSKQLDSAGWKRVTEGDSTSVAASWSKTGAARDVQEVSITVSPIAGQSNCYNVVLSATYSNPGIR